VVVDASVALKWVLIEEYTRTALMFYRDMKNRAVDIVTPPNYEAEVTNGVWRRVARGLVTFQEGLQLLDALQEFPTISTTMPDLFHRAFQLSQRTQRAAIYDQLYVALADVLGCDLWTADGGLVNSFAPLGFPVRLLSTYSS